MYNFPKASRLSMAVKLEIQAGKISRCGFLPLHIGRDAVPRFALRSTAEHADVVSYMEAVTGEAGLNGTFRVTDDLVEVGGAQ